MSLHRKYFKNKFKDYAGEIAYDQDESKSNVLELVEIIKKNFKCVEKNVDGGLYSGLPGVAYMLYHLSKLPAFESSQDDFLYVARKYVEFALGDIPRMIDHLRPTRITGFVTGLAGLYAMSAVLYHKLGDEFKAKKIVEEYEGVSQMLFPLNWNEGGSDELFVGRAGYLCGLLWMQRELGYEVLPGEKVFKLLDAIIESGVAQAKSVKGSFPLIFHYHDKFYLGPAHGLSGILFILLRFPKWLKERPKSETLIKDTIDALLAQQTPSGNFPSSLGSVRHDEDELVHWCHGAPGVIHLLAKAYLVFKDEKYLNAAIKCGDVTWSKGLLKKGPGLCHGLASSGYTFLVLYKLTEDKRHLHRAISFANFYRYNDFEKARTPDRPYSLYEGIGGFACFSADLIEPESAEFPFFSLD